VCPKNAPPEVLIVDDDTDFRSALALCLEGEGYTVAQATDGVEALSCVTGQRPGVILLDLLMPRMDGFELLERLRADPALAAVPVLILTGTPVENIRSLGVEAVVQKPMAIDALVSLMERIRARRWPDEGERPSPS
jgi:CheY-like chemotaxis protein